jgi:hypothetical protein
MSLLIRSFKPHENMRIGNFSQQNMLINFETEDTGPPPETSSAVQLVKYNYHADTAASFQTFPPDELQTINNLQTQTPFTIHNYRNPTETPRFGVYKYTLASQNGVRIWAYENDTKVYTQTYPSNTITLFKTLQKYQKIESYTLLNGETVFSNKALSCGFQGSLGKALNLSHARGKVFMDNCRRATIQVYIVSHHDNNTVKYQISTSQAQQTVILQANQEFTFNSSLTSAITDFWTIHSTEDISCFATGVAQDHDTCYPCVNINTQGMLTGLQNAATVMIWDTSNPTGVPNYELIVNYSDNTTDTIFTNAGKTVGLPHRNYIDLFARLYLTGSTPNTVYMYCGSEGDGGGNNSTNGVPISHLSSRIQFDDSIDNPSHIQHVAFGIQFSTGADTMNQSTTILDFNGEATPVFDQAIAPYTVNMQPDGTKLIHYRLGTDIDRHLFDTTHSTTLFYIVTQISDGEEAVTGTCDGVRSVINTSEYLMNSKKALNMNATGLSQTIGGNEIYDTPVFGITTLCVFRKDPDQYNNRWEILTGHGAGTAYFAIRRYGPFNNIAIQFQGQFFSGAGEMISFDFGNPQPLNYLVYGSVKQTDTEEFEFILELHSFSTAGTSTLVDQKIFTKTLTLIPSTSTTYVVGMDQLTNELVHYGSLTVAETRHYKGNFTTNDKDNLIQNIINYWGT